MKPILIKSSFAQDMRDYLLITFGLICYAVGFTCFQLPYEITGGGAAGIGALLFYAFGIPAQYTFFVINFVLLSIAVKVLGWRFCLKTIFGVFGLTFFIGLGQEAIYIYGTMHPELAQSAQGLPQLLGDQAFMACVIGAVVEGIGLGFIFLSNGSTGGTDIVAAIVNKYKDMSFGQIMMLCDLTIITSSLFIPTGTIPKLLYGYCTLIIVNLLLDFVVDRGRQSVQFLIISKKFDLIASEINKTGRGVTVLDSKGWYTQEDGKVLMVLAKKRESNAIFRIIQSIDPNAFISQSKVIGVFGEGFDRIKVKAKEKK